MRLRRSALPAPAPAAVSLDKWRNPFAGRRGIFAGAAALCAAVVGIGAAVLPWRAIAPIARAGRLGLFGLDHGARPATRGARRLRGLPYQYQWHPQRRRPSARDAVRRSIYSTNITPDVATGIGGWSYPAFERAMREGIHRDGRQLYPAFPYPHFARATDADLQALYAHLMAQAPVRADTPKTNLAFPFNLRPLLAGWNALFHQPQTFQADATKSQAWNRGAYLVEGLGHCGACHSPRNALGAEKASAYLAGGLAEGWEAPALTSLSHAPIPWSEDELYAYLRTGESRFHGVAAGPMAPVVKELTALPEQDIRAMAVYLASFNETAIDQPAQQALAVQLEASTGTRDVAAASAGARLYQGACAVCHEVGGAPLFGSRPSLALNSNLHSARPDNLIQIVLHGISAPASGDLGYMPAFKDSMSDSQIAGLVSFLRRQFAPGKPAWTGLEAAVSRARLANTP